MSVLSITVGPDNNLHAGSLLHEQIRVGVSAQVKGKQKDYDWIAKIHRSQHETSNYARFQVFNKRKTKTLLFDRKKLELSKVYSQIDENIINRE